MVNSLTKKGFLVIGLAVCAVGSLEIASGDLVPVKWTTACLAASGPADYYGVRIEMPRWFYAGDDFSAIGYIDNTGEPREDVPVAFVLAYGDCFWVWDDWVHYSFEQFSIQVEFPRMTIPTGTTQVDVLSFHWPQSASIGSMTFILYGALLNYSATEIEGYMAISKCTVEDYS